MILVAGVGNIFFGDDAFGPEVVQRLQTKAWPDDVRIIDFGIRGLDFFFALLDDYDPVIVVDAIPRGERPGTLHLVEADLAALGEGDLETHDMNPVRVLAAARRTGVRLGEVYLLGCEPAALEGMGLSEPVKQAVHPAVDMIERLIHQLRARKKESYESGTVH